MDAALPFAKHVLTQKTVSVDEVDRGSACGCVCLFCDAPVQARKGTVKIHHFAHMPRAVEDEKECPASFSRCVFWMTRRILTESRAFIVPAYEYKLIDLRRGKREETHVNITREKSIEYTSVEFPMTLSEQKDEDVAILEVAGHKLMLRIKMGARSAIAGASAYKESPQSIATLGVYLDNLWEIFQEHSQTFRAKLEEMILRNSASDKQWIYHPRAEQLQHRFEDAEVVTAEGIRYLVAPRAKAPFRDAKTGRLVIK